MNIVQLGNHVNFVSGYAFKSKNFNDRNEGLPVIRIRDVKKGFSETYTTEDYDLKYVIEKGDYLIGMDGEFNLAKWNSSKALLNQRVCKIGGVSKEIHLDYLAKYLPVLLKEIERKTPFVTVKHLSVKTLNLSKIPLPPLPEQKRIASILDATDALRSKRRQAIAMLDELLQATFLDMFGDPVTNPKGWEVMTIGDLMSSVNYGSSKKASEIEGQYPILRMNNITYLGAWDFTSLKYIDLDDKEKTKHLVYKGQILFNRTNSKELVGKTAVYRLETPMAFAGYLVRAVVNDENNPEYIGAFMNLPQTKQLLKNKCKNIVGMANINAKEFQRLSIPKPPLTLQTQFAEIVEKVEAQKAVQQAHLAELDTLFASLQQRAFAGDL